MRADAPSAALWTRRCSVMLLSVTALWLGVISQAGAASFYWYGNNGSTCWQTGQLGSPGEGCDSVGAGFLPTPGGHSGGLEHMLNDTVGGIGDDFKLSPSGDYCSYYGAGDNLTLQVAANQGSVTGYTTPEPFSSYQEGDANGTVCQANGSHWGQELRSGVSGGLCGTGTCGMHHYVSLTGQGTNERPWNNTFGSPSLVVHAEAGIQTFNHTGSSYGGWGYVCPELEDTSTHGVLEYCFEEWRSANNESKWKDERIGECNSPWSQIITYFYPGTQFATDLGGSSTFEVGSAGAGDYEAEITGANLENAIKLADSSNNGEGGHPKPGVGCGLDLSTKPENYALIGVEQGLEGWHGVEKLGGSAANLQLRTEYTPLPPEATTKSASAVKLTEAKVNGMVNPRGTSTKYYFKYGKTTSYGHTTPETSAGSGEGSIEEQASLAGLEPNTTYHFRLVATSSGGTVEGGDETFTTEDLRSDILAVEKLGSGYCRYMMGPNQGEGTTFGWEYTNLREWGCPRNLALGDFTGKYENDILAVEQVGNGSCRYMMGPNHGEGTTFGWEATNLTGMTCPEKMAVGDLTGNGKADILSVEPIGNGYCRYMAGINDGEGTTFDWQYTNLKEWGCPQSLALGDLRGEDFDDILAVEQLGNGYCRYMMGPNHGEGTTFGWEYTNLREWGCPRNLALGDLTGNGLDDIVAIEQLGNGLCRYMVGMNKGEGITFNWDATNLTEMTCPDEMAVADLTGNGKADILSVEPIGNGYCRYMVGINQGEGTTFDWQYTNLKEWACPEKLALGPLTGK